MMPEAAMKHTFWLLNLLFSLARGALCSSNFTPVETPEPEFPDYFKIKSQCHGYKAVNGGNSRRRAVTARLLMNGDMCNIYGYDVPELVVKATYEDINRLHVTIMDPHDQAYQVPEEVFPRPKSGELGAELSSLKFSYTDTPFAFQVSRSDTDEVLFDTSAANLIFESQYVRLRTYLPEDPYLYGLGEHSDPFRLGTTNYTRTLWNRDARGLPERENLYSSHPFYLEMRDSGAHGVFLLNSNGMDVFIDKDENGKQYMEYNTLGGILDFYFLAGPSPVDVARQYSEIVGKPAMPPYWSLGLHQSRTGYRDAFALAEVVSNYSIAKIPLEAVWTDTDSMNRRRPFTLDEERFPVHVMHDLINVLHQRDLRFIQVIDAGIGYVHHKDDGVLRRGRKHHSFLRLENGTEFIGTSYAGPSVYPDFFAPSTERFYKGEFGRILHKELAMDVDGLWLDMNEPSSYLCPFPCDDPFSFCVNNEIPTPPPPVREPPHLLPGFPCYMQPPHLAPWDCYLKPQLWKEQKAEKGWAVGRREEEEIAREETDIETVDDNRVYWAAKGENERWEDKFDVNDRLIKSTRPDLIADLAAGDIEDAHSDESPRLPEEPHSNGQADSLSPGRSSPGDPDVLQRRWKNDFKPAAKMGFPTREFLYPQYAIKNKAAWKDSWNADPWGGLSNFTVNTNVVHRNGLVMYDTHNLYGMMQGMLSRKLMLWRRPKTRPFVISRSTFPGAGAHMGKWLGDNLSTWDHFRKSIRGMLSFSALFQFGMVGSTPCGYSGNATEDLCARWTAASAFQTLLRNHNGVGFRDQEFYAMDAVADSARFVFDIRYRLLDYLYTAIWHHSQSGAPAISPMMYIWPDEKGTWDLELQYVFGPALVIAPVTRESATSVDVYLPKELFYDWKTHEPIRGQGAYRTLKCPSLTDIPILMRAGIILPLREQAAPTTNQLRRRGFELLVPVDDDIKASGELYLDDGETLSGDYTHVFFNYEDGVLAIDGDFGYDGAVGIRKVTLIGGTATNRKQAIYKEPGSIERRDGGNHSQQEDDDVTAHVLSFKVNIPLTEPTNTTLSRNKINKEMTAGKERQ